MNFRLKMQIIMWGMGSLIVAGIASAPTAIAGPEEQRVVAAMQSAGIRDARAHDAFQMCIGRATGLSYEEIVNRFPWRQDYAGAEKWQGTFAAINVWCPDKA